MKIVTLTAADRTNVYINPEMIIELRPDEKGTLITVFGRDEKIRVDMPPEHVIERLR